MHPSSMDRNNQWAVRTSDCHKPWTLLWWTDLRHSTIRSLIYCDHYITTIRNAFIPVSVVNSATQQIDYSFQGSAYVQLSSSPTGYESLYFGQNCDHLTCGQKVVGSLVSVPFVNGLATFSVIRLSLGIDCNLW